MLDHCLLLLLTVSTLWATWGRNALSQWRTRQQRKQLQRQHDNRPVVVQSLHDHMTLLLHGDGAQEHEITLHNVTEAPAMYAYAGKQFHRMHKIDANVWEYQR